MNTPLHLPELLHLPVYLAADPPMDAAAQQLAQLLENAGLQVRVRVLKQESEACDVFEEVRESSAAILLLSHYPPLTALLNHQIEIIHLRHFYYESSFPCIGLLPDSSSLPDLGLTWRPYLTDTPQEMLNRICLEQLDMTVADALAAISPDAATARAVWMVQADLDEKGTHAALKEATLRAPHIFDSYCRLLETAEHYNDLTLMHATLERMKAQAPQHPLVLTWEMALAQDQHHPLIQQAKAQQLLQMGCTHLGILTGLAEALREQGNYPACKAVCHDILRRDPYWPEGYFELALLAEVQGHYEEALEMYHRALQLDAKNVSAYKNMGGIYFQKDDLDAAEAAFQKVLELVPDVWYGQEGIGRIRFSQKRYEDALHIFETIRTERPQEPIIGYLLGRTYFRLERFAEMEQVLRSVQAAYTHDAIFLKFLAIAFTSLDKFAEAIDAYRHSLAIDASQVETHINLASVLAAVGEYPEAKREYNAAMHLDPTDFTIREEYMELLKDLKEWDELRLQQRVLRRLQRQRDHTAGEQS